jgi:hypothetical protein
VIAGLFDQMRLDSAKLPGALALLSIAIVAAPVAASARPGIDMSVETVHGRQATAAAPINVLTITDQRRIDNRISAYTDVAGRLVLTAPEGLRDPDGSGENCRLDNAKTGESSAQQVSCASGYIGAIVGDLGSGGDTFNADPALAVMVGAVIDGVRRPLWGGPGRDRLVGGLGADLLDGTGGADSLIGGGGEDLLVGDAGADHIGGGAANDVLLGGPGPDRLAGGAGRDLCRGAGDTDRGKSCELARSIP